MANLDVQDVVHLDGVAVVGVLGLSDQTNLFVPAHGAAIVLDADDVGLERPEADHGALHLRLGVLRLRSQIFVEALDWHRGGGDVCSAGGGDGDHGGCVVGVLLPRVLLGGASHLGLYEPSSAVLGGAT